MTSVANLKLSEEEGSQSGTTPGTPSSVAGTPLSSSPMDRGELVAAVRKQVEYYFSKENLERDAYLTSQMDAQNTVPMSVIMKFSKMKSLVSGDEDVVREALADSSVCPVTEEGRIKALVKGGLAKGVGRSTIILREIPADTPEAAIRDIFAYDGCRHIVSVRSDIGDTWFVEMDSETDAKDTLLDLKLKRRTFNGESVRARLKTEVAVRSFYSQPPPVPAMSPMAGYQGMPVAPYGFGPNGSPIAGGAPGAFGYPPGAVQMVGPDGLPIPPAGVPMAVGPDGARGGVPVGYGAMPLPIDMTGGINNSNGDGSGKVPGAGRTSNKAGKEGGGRGPPGGGRSDGRSGSNAGTGNGAFAGGSGSGGINSGGGRGVNAKSSPSGRPGAAAGGAGIDRATGGNAARQGKGKGANAKGGAAASGATNGGMNPVPVDLNLQNFPPLHVDEAPVPTPGYEGSYKKYTADEIIQIVSTVKDAPMPLYALNGQPLVPSEHGHAMTATPNMDLLRRQRSFSIDETREQLQQGKPVHREAVAAGAVDYASLAYGDPRRESMDEASIVNAHITTANAGAIVDVAIINNAINSHPGSTANSAPGSAQRSRSNSNIGTTGAKGGRIERQRGVNAVPSASSWAALVKSSSSSSTQTDSPAAVNKSGPSSPARATKAKTIDPKIAANTSTSKGTSAGKEGEAGANKGRAAAAGNSSSGGRNKKDPAPKDAAATAAAAEGAAPSGWGTKPSFANMLKASSAEEAVAAAAGATSVGTQSEFSEMTGARGRARTSSKDKGALANNPNRAAAAGVGAGAGVARQPTTIATEADGSWARKTFS